MATTEYRKIQIRRDTAANFAAVVLADGEPAWYNDTKRLVIGDGVTAGGIKLNPMTAVGDVVVGGAAGAATRLAVGSAGQILTVSAGSPVWSSTISAATTFSSGTPSTSTTTGSVIVTGGLGVSGAAFIGSNLVVGTGAATVYLATDRGTTTQNNFHRWRTAGADNWAVGSGATGTNSDLEFYTYGIGRSFTALYATGNVIFDRQVLINGATTAAAGSLGISATDPALRLKMTGGSAVADLNTYEIRSLGSTGNTYLQFRTVNDAQSVFTTRMALWQDGGLYLGTNPGGVGSPGAGCLNLTGTTAASSTTTGALVVAGGVGVAGAVYVGGSISSTTAGPLFLSTGGTTSNKYLDLRNTGGGFWLGLESSAGTTIFSNSTAYSTVFGTQGATPLILGTNGIGRMTIASGGDISMTGILVAAGTSGHYFAMPASGIGFTIRYTGGTNNPGLFFTTTEATGVSKIDASGSTGGTMQLATAGTLALSLSGGAVSTSSTTGALVVNGGVGISGKLFVGGEFNVTGTAGDSTISRTGVNGAGSASLLNIATDGKTIGDAIGITFSGQDSASTPQTYLSLRALIVDPTSGSEDSSFVVRIPVNGTQTDIATFSSAGAAIVGSVTTAAPAGGTAAAWKMGTVAAVSPTAPNRTIELDVAGTRYFLHAKTTND